MDIRTDEDIKANKLRIGLCSYFGDLELQPFYELIAHCAPHAEDEKKVGLYSADYNRIRCVHGLKADIITAIENAVLVLERMADKVNDRPPEDKWPVRMAWDAKKAIF